MIMTLMITPIARRVLPVVLETGATMVVIAKDARTGDLSLLTLNSSLRPYNFNS